MATMMPSAFTAPDRRKKVVTYGKTSRLAPPQNATADNDAPSPERPRKKSTLPPAPLKKIGNGNSDGSGQGRGMSREKTGSPDIFDVPSDDDLAARPPTATKKFVPKRQAPAKDPNPSRKEVPAPSTRVPSEKPLEIPRKTEASRPMASSTIQRSQKPGEQSNVPKVLIPRSESVAGPSVRRGKTPQATAAPKQDTAVGQTAQRAVAKPKVASQTAKTTPGTLKTQKPVKPSALPSKRAIPKTSTQQPHNLDLFDVPSTEDELRVQTPKASKRALPSQKPTTVSARDLEVFDMPSSDDEAHIPTPKPLKKARTAIRKAPMTETKAPSTVRKHDNTESDDSTASRKRKRNGSVSSIAAKKPVFEQSSGQSLPQRSLKYQKNADSVSPGHNSLSNTASVHPEQPPQAPLATNKPRRTRVRTVPIISQPPTKAQSSPADLRNMLAKRAPPQSPRANETFEATAPEDETVYEIPDSFATPLHSSSKSISGSVTPRQKALFGNLLGTASATPSMPSISKLQLTDTKPKSLLGALSRSRSEMTPTANAKRTRLIASLKHAESSSDDEAGGSESDSGSEAMVESQFEHKHNKISREAEASTNGRIADDDMNLDVEVAADSQTSQTTTGYGNRPKFTYAKARSYLQEANPEDEFYMSMDIDEPTISASQTRDSQTEDEEEMSQVRANHELKRHGQNTKFEWENLMLIDDIASKSSNSIRRSALLELTTKMADASFAHELLDSSLAQQFLDNLTSNGEIIFDFAAAVATVFMLNTNPTYTTLEQIHHSNHMTSLVKLLDNTIDIEKIAKNRKTNLSRIAIDAVVTFRLTTLKGCSWSPAQPEILSPQIIAIKALEPLELGLRGTGSAESAISQDALVKLVEIAYTAAERCKAEKKVVTDQMVLKSAISILEAASLATQQRLVWTAQMMQSLALSMSIVFQLGDAAAITLAVKLCMNLTNNKPKACHQFSNAAFVRSLTQSITNRIHLLQQGREDEQRTETLDTLILSLGAMINLTEHSDQARVNTDDGDGLLETLVKAFVEGSARTTQVSITPNSPQSLVLTLLRQSLWKSRNPVSL